MTHGAGSRALKQTVVVEWQTTLLTSVLSTLHNFRSGLLRLGLNGVAGLPDIVTWMNSGNIMTYGLNYAVVRAAFALAASE